jgi:hypothetical protein
MSVPQTVAEVLAKHVVLEVESINRMYLNVHAPVAISLSTRSCCPVSSIMQLINSSGCSDRGKAKTFPRRSVYRYCTRSLGWGDQESSE